MKTIEIEGIRLTAEMVSCIKNFQRDDGLGVEGYTKEIDEAVSFIVTQLESPMLGYEKKALSVITGLIQLKEILIDLSGKEIQS